MKDRADFTRRSLWLVVLVVFALFAATIALEAQQPVETTPFFGSGQAFDAGNIDNINLYSGDVGISIPLGPAYPLGPTGFQYQLQAFNSVKFWHYSGGICGSQTAQFAWLSGDPTLGVGWTLQPGYVVKRSPPGVSAFWQYYGPDGSAHQVDLTTSNPAITTDGSFLRIKALPDQFGTTSYTVEFPDGSIQTFNHSYSAPAGSPASIDFRNIDFGETALTRYGLGTIKDRFGNTLVTVNWDPAHASEVLSVSLTALGTSSIAFTWVTSTGSPMWRVLDKVVFPAPNSEQLQVKFNYSAATFNRSDFDTSHEVGTCGTSVSPDTVGAPELSSIAFSDPNTPVSMLPFSYAFTYWGNPASGAPQKQAAVNVATLPSLGTITYDYDVTLHQPCLINPPNGCDPNGLSDDPGIVDNPQPPPVLYSDSSVAVISRTEHDPFTNRDATTTYARKAFKGLDENQQQDYNRAFLRTTVISPGNDDGSGPSQYARRHYFYLDIKDPLNPPKLSGGIELERRYFADANPIGTPIRTLIKCYLAAPGGCGVYDDAGLVQVYDMRTGRTPSSGTATWFGAAPSTADGNCTSTSSPECISLANSNYNSTAGKYKTTVIKSFLPGGVNRTIETNWTPNVVAPDYLLDLYDHVFTWDGGGAGPPAGSNGSTVVRGYADFESTTGFLKGTRTWDSSSPATAIMNCRFTAGSTGIVSFDYSQSYPSAGEPLASNCPMNPPATLPDPPDSDTFGQDQVWTSLLLTKSNWRKGGATIGWNSLDLLRDTATGFVLEARNPNYSISTTLKTTYTYDSLGRVVMIQPPGGSGVEWPTTFCYIPGGGGYTPFVIVKKTTASPVLDPTSTAANGICKRDSGTPGAGSGSMLGQNFDGFGRLVREVHRNPTAFSTTSYFARRDLRYDSAGHLTFSSDWQACPLGGFLNIEISGCATPNVVNALTAPGPTAQNLNFDPFGRAQEIRVLNGGNWASDVTISRTDSRTGVSPAISFSDTYEDVTTNCINSTWSGMTCSGGINSHTATEYDALGRITQVTEPDKTTGALSSDKTSYSYNVQDQATVVTQGSQTRSMNFSAFGFLKDETTPENGANGNATTKYSLYGSIGNLRTKLDPSPGGTTYNYTYDAAGRLTLLTTGTGAPFTQYLVSCYDGTGACGDTTISNFTGGTYPKGKVSRRLGINQIPFTAAAVYDDFSYSAASGRLSAQTTSTGQRLTDLNKNGFGTPVTQSWTYNTLGLVATHVHPRSAGSASTLTVNDSAYTSGFLTNITATKQGGSPQQLLSDHYQESGRLADYTTGGTGTTTTTIGAGSVIPSRWGSLKAVSSSSGNLFPQVNYGYDGVSSIKSIGSDTFAYDARSRLTSSFYADLTGGGTQTFGYDRYGNLTSKAGVTLNTSVTTNHLSPGTYDARGNVVSLANGAAACSGQPDTACFDALDRMTRVLDSSPPPGTDFTYLYDGAGERVAKIPSGAGALRREFARIAIEARGDSPLSCTNPGPFNDVTCASNPNDGKYVQKLKDVGITSGCGNGNYCPDASTLRQEAAVFFLKAKWCPLNGSGCAYAPPPCTPPPNQRFADVFCPSLYADWIEELADENITSGCGNGNFCPNDPVGTFNMLAWAAAIWPTYNPLPRDAVLTYRDQDAHVITEAHQQTSTGDSSENLIVERDNVFLGSQLVASGIWSGSNWTTLNYNFYASDHLGTPRLVTDINASQVALRKFWPYGDDGPNTGGDAGQRLKLAGMERDSESENYYDHARVENFNIGRFLTKDPVRGEAEYPQSWNRYSYVLNNPMTLTDPWGLVYKNTDCGGQGQEPCGGGFTDSWTVFGDPLVPSQLWAFLFSLSDLGLDLSPFAPLKRAPQPSPCNASPAGSTGGLGQYLSGLGSAALMLGQFVTGAGPRDVSFDPGSIESRMMASSPGVAEAVGGYFNYGQATGLYTFGLRGFLNAGTNPIQQFVGSYRYAVSPVEGGANVTLENSTSVRSGSYHLLQSHQRSSLPPMGTTHQTYNVFVPCQD